LFNREFPVDIASILVQSPKRRTVARALVLAQLQGGVKAKLAGALWYLRGYRHKMHWRALTRHVWVKSKLAWQQRGKKHTS
jgi:hypothetical protein